ncbi:MAG: insulinase family protein [Deltaproteobacteria bacterium]|nr:insulinase family protein [Deltaproteobacteria bacterium]
MNQPPCNLKSTKPLALSHAVLIVMLAAALSLSGCAGGRARSVVDTPEVALEIEKYTLDNGLEVILHKDDRLPIVAVNLWYHVGPANEAADRTGFAHLFEHMMFQGSAHTEADSFFKHLENAGASMVNGTTDFDRTNYMEDVPSNQLELALWLESDRMGFLLEKVDQTMLSNQQDVVRNERRQSTENAPYGLPEEELYQLLFDENHPYHGNVIGSHEDIQAAKLEDVHDFFKQYYAPNNASIAIVGDFDEDTTKAWIEKYFGSIPRGAAVEPVDVRTAPITEERRAVVTDEVELPRVYMAWITPPIFTPGDAEAMIAAKIFGGGKSSRLYKALVYEQKIAQNVWVGLYPLSLGSVLEISATAKPGHSAKEIEQAIDAELKDFVANPPTPEELTAAKNAFQSQIIRSLEKLGGFGGVADRLNYYNHHLGDPGYLNQDLERFATVTTTDVQAFAASSLGRDARVVVHAIPGEKKLPPNPATPPPPETAEIEIESREPWRNEIPQAGPTPAITLAKAEEFALSNGLRVYVVESHALPVVATALIVRAGSAADPIDQPGLSAFTAAMLDEGTASRDALGIARDLKELGARMRIQSWPDANYITLWSLKRNAAEAMEIMSDVVLAPSFPTNEIERVRDHRITSILQESDSPYNTATRVLWPALYGAEHPYGHVSSGTEESLTKIPRDDLVNFYERGFHPANAALIVAGDLTPTEARTLAETSFGGWAGSGELTPRPSAGERAPERVIVVDKPKAPQTMVLIAQTSVERSHPDYEKLKLMNQVLGGLFSSRLNMNLREKHGYSYGAYSWLTESRGVGPLFVQSSVRADVTGASVEQMLIEVEGMLQKEVTPAELELAKESISRTLPALFETTQRAVETVGELYVYDLPANHYEGLPSRIRALTAAEVFEATKMHLRPDQMTITTVGDHGTIRRQLAPLELGTIVTRTPDGKEVGPSPGP